jgi:putative (di)nucleoside polyphosphate hydrolase
MTPDEILNLPYRPCVGVMLVNAEGRVFTGQRIDSDVAAWQMPQGGIDAGESPSEAGLRELWEETGVTADKVVIEAETEDWVTYDLPPELAGRIWGGKFRGQKQKWLLMRFAGTDDDVRIATEHPEFSEWCWMAPESLVDNIVPFKREVYARVLAEFGERL